MAQKKNSRNNTGLYSPVTDLKGVGPKKAEAFLRLGIEKIADVLELYPREYEDLRNKKRIFELKDGEKAVVTARVLNASLGRGFGRKRTLHVLTEDDTGRMEVLFFNGTYLLPQFKTGQSFRFFGKVKCEYGRVSMFHPSYARSDGEVQEGILPVYPLTRGLVQKDVRHLSAAALEMAGDIPETLPAAAISSANLCGIGYAYRNIHYPEGDDQFRAARYRLVYEELFYLDTALALSRSRGGKGRKGRSFDVSCASEFTDSLPYKLTNAQSRALSEILSDMNSDKAMNRLVQGDVGSGKTAVACAAMFTALKNGSQSAFMAPTDILARQHFETLKKLFKGFDAHIELLTSSMSSAEKRKVLKGLADGSTDIAVGTHALISDNVEYKDLGLVITDEQHRFGVSQRQQLSAKGTNPDVLVMTATPIPRTLAVVLYADLDLSVIDELPPGRMPVETRRYDASGRNEAYKILESEVRAGRQAYVVAPFIEDSDALDAYSAESLYEETKSRFPDIACGLLHGRMTQQEKDSVMERFYSGELRILVSTVVIEVGIDVPNATVMVIENSERFGLAQMHQLRGRVGRGKHKSYCLIITDSDSETAVERAEIMCSTSDGFVIANKDLEIRGPGEFFGYRQHGLPQLRLADPVKHGAVAAQALKDVKEMLSDDPSLTHPRNAYFAQCLRNKYMQSDRLTL